MFGRGSNTQVFGEEDRRMVLWEGKEMEKIKQIKNFEL